MMTEEIWKDVEEFEDYYEVSNLGRVRSKDRYTPNLLTGGRSLIKGRVLAGKVDRGGYRKFTLCIAQVNYSRTLHRLVAKAHIPNPDNFPLVLHGPNGNGDNSVSNLRWGTYSDNARDKRRDGTDPGLNKTHCPQNHEYTEENTRMDAGARKCKTCERARSLKRYWEIRNAELERRAELGIPERIPVPRCDHCGRFLGKKHTCKENV